MPTRGLRDMKPSLSPALWHASPLTRLIETTASPNTGSDPRVGEERMPRSVSTTVVRSGCTVASRLVFATADDHPAGSRPGGTGCWVHVGAAVSAPPRSMASRMTATSAISVDGGLPSLQLMLSSDYLQHGGKRQQSRPTSVEDR